MQTHLSAGGASCQICFEPFGPLEDLSAPFIVACGHVFCVGCLNDAGPRCPICGMNYDRSSYDRLLGLRTTVPRRPRRSYDSEVMGAKLRNDFARVTSLTSVVQLRSLHSEARYFLNLQPRNRFNDLETNDRLLQYLLEAKETLQTQGAMTNTFVEQIHHLSSEKIDLSLQLREMERRHASERAYIRTHVSDLLRRDPDFNLLSEEVLQFQTDMNDLRQSLHILHVQNGAAETPPTPAAIQQPTPEFAPRIRVYPASRSPSPVHSALESAYESLSPLSMSAIGDDFGIGQPQIYYGDNLDIPRAGTRSSNIDTTRERQAVFAQIRRRSRLHYSSAPDLRALRSENPSSMSSLIESHEQDGESSSLYSSERDGDDETPYYSPLANMDASFISQAPSISEVDAIELVEDNSDEQAAETPSVQSIDDHTDTHNTSAPISTISTPSLPLLQTPPGLRLQLVDLDSQLNNQLLLSTTPQSRLVPEAGVPHPLPPRLRRSQSIPPSLNVRALNDLLNDLVGRAPDQHHHHESGNAHAIGGSIQAGGGLLSDVRTGLVEVLARVLMHLATNTGVRVGPISSTSALRAGARAAQAESLSPSAVRALEEADGVGSVVEPLPVPSVFLPPFVETMQYNQRDALSPGPSERSQTPSELDSI